MKEANLSQLLEESVDLINPYSNEEEVKVPKVPKINKSAAQNAAAKATQIL